MDASTATAKAHAFTARQSTPALVTSLRMVEAQLDTLPAVSDDAQALRLTRSWVIVELEHRFPAASDAVDAAFAAADETGGDVDYVVVLLDHIPDETREATAALGLARWAVDPSSGARLGA